MRIDALIDAVQALVARYDVLRTRLVMEGANLIQMVDPVGPKVVFEDWSTNGASETDNITRASQRARELVDAPYDMAGAAPCRPLVLKLSDRAAVFCLATHHIAGDNWSLSHVLPGDFRTFYAALANGQAPDLEPIRLHYADYAAWQQSDRMAALLQKQADYWRDALADISPVLDLPVDRPRPSRRGYDGGTVEAQPFSVNQWRAIETFAVAHDCTPYMVFHTALACVLARLCNTDDVVIGTPHVSKPHADLWPEFGYFGNTLAVRSWIKPGDRFVDVLASSRRAILGAFRNADIPFERVVAALDLPQGNASPVFQVMLVMHAFFDRRALEFGELSAEVIGDAPAIAKYDLSIDVNPHEDGASIILEYATDIFDRPTVHRIGRCLRCFLLGAIASADRPVGALPILDEDDRDALTHGVHRTDRGRDGPALTFERMGDPDIADVSAIVVGEQSVTYGDLDRASTRLAHTLVMRGIGRETAVGVCLPRSVALITTLVAILKVGGAYLPLDPDMPTDRLGFMAADSGMRLLVTTREHAGRFDKSVPLLLLDDPTLQATIDAQPVSPAGLPGEISGDGLAYILYTSGSTGRPKGVMVPRWALDNALRATGEVFGETASRIVLSLTGIGFDVSLEDFLLPLMTGGQIVLADRDRIAEPGYVVDLACRAGVTMIDATPAVWSMIDPGALPADVTLVTGGDALQPADVERLVGSDRRVLNLYGPTETAISVTSACLTKPGDATVIGRPMMNCRAYVVDRFLNLQPVGVVGELAIGGVQLARGYVGRPGLSAETFVADPFSGDAGARLYRTGDLVRRREDGSLEFRGRVDHQVKIRGQRVELLEIDAVLSACDGVAGVATVLRSNDLLVAYIVPLNMPSTDGISVIDLSEYLAVDTLKEHLGQMLPAHMVPAAFIGLNQFPLGATGKVDRVTLPMVDLPAQGARFLAPRTDLERLVASAFSALLEVAIVGAGDDFFALGGHSLLAGRLIGFLAKETGRKVALRSVFQGSTVEAIASALEKAPLVSLPAIPTADRSAPLPLSHQQERLWFMDRLDPQASLAYHVMGAWRITGPLKIDTLTKALGDSVDRHESLRASICVIDGHPAHTSLDLGTFSVPVEDVPGGDAKDLQRRIATLMTEPFDLNGGVLFRATILRLSAHDHVLAMGGHHIVLDGWSVDVLLKEISALYAGATTQSLPALTHQYADYALGQRQSWARDRLSAQTDWWRAILAGAPSAIDLPFDRPRPAVMDYAGDIIRFAVSQNVANDLQSLASSKGVTLFVVLETAFATLLHRLGGDKDLIVGTAVAGRDRVELESAVGFFVNVVALRHRIDPHRPFADLLVDTRDIVLGAFDHGDVPFASVVDAFAPERSLSHAPLVQAMFVLQTPTQGRDGLRLDDLAVSPMDTARTASPFELSMSLEDTGDGFRGTLTFATQLFDRATAERYASIYVTLLKGIVSAPTMPVRDMPLLDDVQWRQVVETFNVPLPYRPSPPTLVDFMAETVDRCPDAIAMIDGARSITYAEVDREATRLARVLIDRGVGPEQVVGVCLNRSVDLIVAFFAVMKAGGAYLPLEPTTPVERLRFMVEDSRALLTVTDAALKDQCSGAVLLLNSPETLEAIDRAPVSPITDRDRPGPLTGQSLCYVIYTSGSTGKPKGVMVQHASIARLGRTQGDWMRSVEARRVGLWASISFDMAVSEILHTWEIGGTLVVVPEDARAGGAPLIEFLRNYEIDAISLAARVAQDLQDVDGLPLKLLLSAGEAMTPDFASRISRRLQLINGYGPTETTVGSAAYWVPGDFSPDQPTVPIGRPFQHLTGYVVDQWLTPLPIGIPGELLVGGQQLARGYLNRPGLTADRFIADPFSQAPGARLYRTGDLVRWRADGVLEFLGRIDHQIKIRGMRVELGEIEALLAQIDGVATAIAAVQQGTRGEGILVAYLVPDGGRGDGEVEVIDLDPFLNLDSVRSTLSDHLPAHMIPNGFVGLTRLPLTTSGKIDRKALPAVEATVAQAPYAPPRTETEALLCRIAFDVISHDRLDLGQVGIDDNFFDIGGHSILAAHYASRVEQALGRPVPVRLVFEAPTVRGQVGHLESRDPGEGAMPIVTPVDRSGPIPASFEQERMWFLNEVNKGVPLYNEEQTLVFYGPMDTAALIRTVDSLLDRYEVLRTRVVEDAGVLLQVVNPVGSVQVAFEDWSSSDRRVADLLATAQEQSRATASVPYDLSQEAPCRSAIFKLDDQTHVWFLGTHHIAGDNWSLSHVLPGDFWALYHGYSTGGAAYLPPIRLHYVDYAAWQRSAEMASHQARQLAFWRQTLDGIPEMLALPVDRPRPAVRDNRGDVIEGVRLSMDEWRRVETFAVERDATPFMVFVAALSCVLTRLGAGDDIVIGTPHVTKPHADLWPEFGYFGNTLAIRTRVEALRSFEAIVETSRRSVLDAFRHQDVPFERVIETLGLTPADHTPVFQVMMVMHAFFDDRDLVSGDIRAEPLTAAPKVAKYDLTLDINPGQGGAIVMIEYATDVFDRATVARIGAMLRHVLLHGLADPGNLVARLPILEQAEASRLTGYAMGSHWETPDSQTVVNRIERMTASRAGHAAVIGRDRTLTYADFEAEANRLARHLIAIGIGPETVVGVCLDRMPQLIIALHAVLKAGAAYLPLDPEYPVDRLAFMAGDAGASLIMTTNANADGFDGAPVLRLDDKTTKGTISRQSSAPIQDRDRLAPLTGATLAYILYTSGSTGRPKGVLVDHTALLNFLDAMIGDLDLGEEEVFMSMMATAFDVSMEDYCLPLMAGGTIVLADRDRLGDPDYLGVLTRDHRFTVAHTTPSVWAMMFEAGYRAAPQTRLITGGEVVPQELSRRFQRSGRGVWNMYGPTEATITASHARLVGGEVPGAIGRPVGNTRLYVVDPYLNIQPIGMAGELLIGGRQVARGYVGRPGLTADRFIADPFSGEPGTRLYRTGDMARWRQDGTLEFLGRVDDQVKVRGMRIELGEIETVLAGTEGLAAAVVVAEPAQDDRRLIAYVVPDGVERGPVVEEVDLHTHLDLEALRGVLARTLPVHMVPSVFVGLNQLPLTATGKTDRRALPKPTSAAGQQTYTAPVTQTERRIAAAIADLLGLEKVGRTDGFFALGGHSLMAMKLISRLRRDLGRAMPLKTMFEAPTVAALATAFDAGEHPAYHPLIRLGHEEHSNAAETTTIYCAHGTSGFGTVFRDLSECLRGDTRVVGLQARGLGAGEVPFDSSSDMIDAYQAAIGEDAGDGPIYLLGWSFGGLIAYDLAGRLGDEGPDFRGVILLDSVLERPIDRKLDVGASEDEILQGLGLSELPDDPVARRALVAVVNRHSAFRDGMAPAHSITRPSLLVRAEDTRAALSDPTYGWSKRVGDLSTVDVAADHLDLVGPDAACKVADVIRNWIDQHR